MVHMEVLVDDHVRNASYATPALIALFTIPSVWRSAKSIRRSKPTNHGSLYQDRDGAATEESTARYSIKRLLILIFIGVFLGLTVSFALAVFATVESSLFYDAEVTTGVWELFSSWVFVLLQVIDAFREPQILERYQRGLSSSISFVLIAILAGILLSLNPLNYHHGGLVETVLLIVQMCSAVAVTLMFWSIPRRPDVFTPNGKLVERQFQTSLWTRLSFNWSSDLLDLAATKLIELSDLPALDYHMRAKDVKQSFRSIVLKPTVSLWLQIFWAFRWQLLLQWTLVSIGSVVDAAPQFAVLKLLQYLEARKGFDAIDPKAWLWVGLLLLATLLETLVDYRVNWLMWSELGVPIRSTLTTLIYEKLMKVKDCKEPPSAGKEDNNTALGTNGKPPVGPTPSKTETAKKEAEKKKKGGQSEQDIINMFAVDTNQVGVFGAINQFYVMFTSKFIVSIVFLWLLVGWESLAAGMLAIVLVFPLNKFLAQRYGSFQKELMKARDKKTTVISEALQGIRQIKFLGIEPEWTEKIDKVREEELAKLWQTKLNNLYMMLGSDIAPLFLTVFALATYSFLYGDLLPSVAFTALGVFMQLEGVLGMVPFLFMMGINAKVSCDRIETFLKSAEKPENTYPGSSITFDKVSVTFPSKSSSVEECHEESNEEENDARELRENRFVLRDLTLQFPNDSLSVISGPTGSGKSLLLAAILGEVDVLTGSISVPRPPPADQRFDSKATPADWLIPSAIAFVAQTPWIENATVKDNILFGLPYDEVRYDKVLKACALTQDLEIFESGDLTEVGAQGISLSGGQKWRLTLARAFYSRAGILVLDDVFSALDAHVGRHIYDNVLMGELSAGRTRILVTHHVALCLPRADYVVRLSAKGILEHAGLVRELQQTGDFDDIIKAEEEEANSGDQGEGSDERAPDGRTIDSATRDAKTVPKKLIEDEKRETGSVRRSVYTTYLNATGGIPFWGFIFIFYIIAQGLTLSRSWWIKIWTSSYEHQEKVPQAAYAYAMQKQFPAGISAMALPIETSNRSLGFYLAGYIIISLISAFIDVGRYYLVFRGSLRASRKAFHDMTYSVLRTPLRWLDTVPTGRILNRFTADFQAMDSQLSSNFAQVGASFLSIIGIMVAAVFVSPFVIILALILLAICARIALRYIRGARSIKRLESIQKSPMISHFTSSLQGLSTIRAFAKSEVFESRMHDLIDSFAIATWHNWLFNNWVGFRMAMTGSMFSTLVAAFVVSTRGVDAALGGFALAFALSFRNTVNMVLRIIAATELDMNAAERIFEYSSLGTEDQQGIDVRASWPEQGRLEIEKLEVGYAEDLPAILKGLTFHAEPNQRIGIVGRTGAGKSTLSLALFRFLEARKGSIVIDGVDISTIKLHDLRTRLTIIPQDPVLFSGTIRSNLDPFDRFSDHQLREALQRVHLVPSADTTPEPERETPAESSTSAEAESSSSVTATEPAAKENTNIFLSLNSPISSSGTNLSQGQKQLLCLARAILSRPKLLILDEATSAVDMTTDTLIQRSIREEFANTTLLVVAHRLSTVEDFDRILVMKDGVAAEFGSPKELLGLDEGIFAEMVAQSGEKAELEKNILGS
ncbi:MAG: hypothetical protein M1818_004985 [Claussenomyces sp. TS43310]|nr:MAG: hypothetical protein M1818_004985 [Claussenomyces sp. TS43310]